MVSKHDAIGGLLIPATRQKPTSGGFLVDPEDNSAKAWIDTLGNDLMMSEFDEVYVRFPPEEREYKVQAGITQHDYPAQSFEFAVVVKPVFEERIEYIYEEKSEDKEPG